MIPPLYAETQIFMDLSPHVDMAKKTRICGYPPESVPTLTGNTRVDRVWVRVRVFPDNQKSGTGTGTGMGLLDPSRPRTRTRPAT